MSKKTEPQIVYHTADELMAELAQPLDCIFVYHGKRYKIPVTALSPGTAEKVRELRRKALPPFKRERGPNGSYDELDPKYLKDRDENDKKARAFMVYAHCQDVAKRKAGLTSVDEIYAFVQTLYTENILEIISLTIQGGGLSSDTEVRTDFTLAGGLDT